MSINGNPIPISDNPAAAVLVATSGWTTAGMTNKAIKTKGSIQWSKSPNRISYKKYKGIRLTKVGEQYAMNMVRRHRIWKVFLHQVVGIPWDKVHSEAENLEHSSSDDLIDRLEEMLDFPEFDPHGDPIPDKNGNLPEQKKAKSLSVIQPGSKVKVLKVNDFDSSFLNHISRIGIGLNKEIEVIEVLKFDGSMLLAIDGKELNVSNKLAANIFVINSN